MAGDEGLVSFGGIDAWLRVFGVVASAIRSRWITVAAVTVVFVLVGIGAAKFLPRTYSAQTRLLAKKNYVMPALAHPRRAVPIGSDAPTQSAAEFVLNRQAIARIVEQTGLTDRWERERAPLLRLVDRVRERVQGPLSSEDKAEVIADMLGDRIKVTVQDEIVRVSATWSSPQTVVDIVDAAAKAFLDGRRRMEVQTIADTYSLLERSAAQERTVVEAQLAALSRAQRASASVATLAVPVPVVGHDERPEPVLPPSVPHPDMLEDLRAEVRQARATREQMERQHREQRQELEARVAERRATMREEHPDVQALRRALDRVAQEPEPLIRARREEAERLGEYQARGGRIEALESAAPESGSGAAEALVPATTSRRDVPPTMPIRIEADAAEDYARTLLTGSMANYQDLVSRLSDVQIELETAQAAFAYKYSVSTPPRLPKDAESPNVPMVLLGALVAGLMTGLSLAIALELRSRSPFSLKQVFEHLGIGSTTSSPA